MVNERYNISIRLCNAWGYSDSVVVDILDTTQVPPIISISGKRTSMLSKDTLFLSASAYRQKCDEMIIATQFEYSSWKVFGGLLDGIESTCCRCLCISNIG